MRRSFYILLIFLQTNVAAIELKTVYQDGSAPRYLYTDGIASGFYPDILDEIDRRLHFQDIHFVVKEDYVPFTRSLQLLEDGFIDILIGITKKPTREEKFIYLNEPILELKYLFAKKISDDFEYTGAESLQGKSILVLRGTNASRLLNDIEGVTVYEVKTIEQGIQMISKGHSDLLFNHDFGLEWIILDQNMSDLIDITENFLSTGYQYIIFNKNISSDIVEEIQKTVHEIIADGTIEVIRKKYR